MRAAWNFLEPVLFGLVLTAAVVTLTIGGVFLASDLWLLP